MFASSEQPANPASCATDGKPGTRWCAATGGPEWWQVDLGKPTSIRSCRLEFENPAGKYQYSVKGSDDGDTWRTLAEKKTWEGNPIEVTPGTVIDHPLMTHVLEDTARYVRIEFTDLRDVWASLREIALYAGNFDLDPYYGVIDKYRLRWMDVAYQPGELKAVAYKDGKKIGEQVFRTAGAPAKIRITPDRSTLAANGEDISYILVEAADKEGNLCPLTDHLVRFKIIGPAESAGVGNGNPQSIEPFQADSVKLFFGKAMLIIRSVPEKNGAVQITASADGLSEAEAHLRCETTGVK